MKVKDLKRILASVPEDVEIQFEASFLDEDIRLIRQAHLAFDELGNPLYLRLG